MSNMSKKLDYTELETVIFYLETVENLIKITSENLFDTNSGDLSPWAMQYGAPLNVSVDILDREIEKIGQIYDALHEADNTKVKK